MNGRQHGTGHIVGVNLISGQHQQGRPGMGLGNVLAQDCVCLSQTIACGVMRLAAGTKHQIVSAAGQDKAGPGLTLVQQMGSPISNPLLRSSFD